MESIFSELLRKRISNDILSFDEARRMMSSALDINPGKYFNNIGDNKASLLSMLTILGIENVELVANNNIFEQFKEVLSANGYTYTVVKLEDKWWKTSCGHMLGLRKDNGLFTPLISRGFSYYYLKSAKKRVRINSDNASEYEDFAYCFYKTLPSSRLTVKDLLKFSINSIPKFHLAYVLFLSVIIALLSMLIPYSTKLVFDQIVPSGERNSVFALMFVLLSTIFSICLLSTARSKIFMGLKNMMAVFSQAALFDRLFRIKPSFFRKESAGTVTSQIMGVNEACEQVSEGLVTVVFTFLVSLVYIIQIFTYSHFSAISFAVLLLLSLNILCTWIGFVVMNKKRMKWSQDLARFYGLMYNYLSGIQKIKTNGAEARAFRNWADKFRYTIAFHYVEATLTKLSSSFTVAALFLIVLLVPSSDMSVSDYAAFFSAYGGLAAAITLLGTYTAEFTYIMPAYNKVKPILEAEVEVEKNAKIVREISGNVSITDLSFRYNSSSPYLFKGLNLNIRAGEYVALVGESGCGKSTLMRLMLGFEAPEAGSVFYDQYGVFNVNKSTLRRHLGTCLQGGTLFSGTIIDNVRISNPMATEEEVWEALRIAAIDEDVRDMPGGLYHELDVSGQGLSGGQRQRILIARAVLNHPAVLFMDEATSALDNISQAKVIDNLGKMNCTRITIAHRLSTIMDCDRIIVIAEGRVAEEGSYDALMAKHGIFYELSRRQLL